MPDYDNVSIQIKQIKYNVENIWEAHNLPNAEHSVPTWPEITM